MGINMLGKFGLGTNPSLMNQFDCVESIQLKNLDNALNEMNSLNFLLSDRETELQSTFRIMQQFYDQSPTEDGFKALSPEFYTVASNFHKAYKFSTYNIKSVNKFIGAFTILKSKRLAVTSSRDNASETMVN